MLISKVSGNCCEPVVNLVKAKPLVKGSATEKLVPPVASEKLVPLKFESTSTVSVPSSFKTLAT